MCADDHDLQTMSNKCQPKPPSTEVCTIRTKFFEADSNLCVDWLVCDTETENLVEVTNTCALKAPSETVCAALVKFFDTILSICVEWATCDA